MPDKKLTDSEITIKALKELLGLVLCEGCLQRAATISHTIDLINRLQAENEMLKNAVNRLTNRVCDLKEKDETRHKVFMTKCEELETAKAEAYKEFAERLHIEFRMYGQKDKFNKAKFLRAVDNIFKELVGEDNA